MTTHDNFNEGGKALFDEFPIPKGFPRTLKSNEQLCFIHIGKTGGLTLVEILENQFEPHLIYHEYGHVYRFKELNIEKSKKYKLFRGHFTYGAAKQNIANPTFITMLRNPIERARSVYQHIQRAEHGMRDVVSQMTFEEYAFADENINLDIRNFQTRILSDVIDRQREPNLTLAKQRLKDEFVFIGLTDRYNDSLDMLAYTLNWLPIEDYRVKNVTPKPSKLSNYSTTIIDRIKEINQLDLELYAFAVVLFEQRLDHMRQQPDYRAKARASASAHNVLYTYIRQNLARVKRKLRAIFD